MTDAKGDQPIESIDEPDKSTDARWQIYKQACRDDGREPMLWGDWLAKGQPIPAE